METVEIIAYIVVALIIGGFIIVFTAGINPNDIFKSLKAMVFPEKEVKYESIDSEDLPLKAFNLWEKCGLGIKDMELVLYVKSGSQINKSMLFSTYKKLNLCDSIQSKNQSCGKQENVIIEKDIVIPPAVIKLACKSNNSTLVIS